METHCGPCSDVGQIAMCLSSFLEGILNGLGCGTAIFEVAKAFPTLLDKAQDADSKKMIVQHWQGYLLCPEVPDLLCDLARV